MGGGLVYGADGAAWHHPHRTQRYGYLVASIWHLTLFQMKLLYLHPVMCSLHKQILHLFKVEYSVFNQNVISVS